MNVSDKISCPWCGFKMSIPEKSTTRSFMIAFNRLRREHDYKCEIEGKVKLRIKAELEDANEKSVNAIN